MGAVEQLESLRHAHPTISSHLPSPHTYPGPPIPDHGDTILRDDPHFYSIFTVHSLNPSLVFGVSLPPHLSAYFAG